MTVGIWVLGDQLNAAQSALAGVDPSTARVLLVESTSVLQRRAYHRQKLVLVWSAMRHFAEELRAAGWNVDHVESESFGAAVRDWIATAGISELRVMEPADRGFRQAIEALQLPVPLQWIPSNAFLWSREEFAAWAQGYKQLRLELFYREGRRRFGVLMEGEGKAAQPLGGQWNFDAENRKPPPKGLQGPNPLWFEPDATTQAVIAKLQRIDQQRAEAGLAPLPGDLEPFHWAVTRDQALAVLEHFIGTRLDGFGPYQDAMVSGEPTLWHALLSPYLNLGLLHPLEVIQRLEQAGLEQQVPLAGLEGVIRQILGWREYTHGLYHMFGTDYPALNHFAAEQPLPLSFEQLGGSGLNCLDSVFAELRSNGYAHHIQRLMVLANYGLIAGLNPQALTAWFHRMFIDGHDWVMQTNVIGMGLFADGGRLASKPYAASGNYIKRMSTYCKGCRYDVKQRTGPKACPFNSLYWDFLDRHAESLRRNPRMGLVMKQLEKLPEAELEQIREAAQQHRCQMVATVA
ncbi:MAG: cryptochrome/photolyase family protein [Vulcanococcus sp.]|uniref:cryptochrome/photolyase family protein n=1 Tax=Vulcanococcus sp. TaxID=2856995 RepID=UPI0025DFB756|nr:cryptochrome/photolyase family protein [Vulcanococcus sp.]MBW0167677.1 cryptochrome/photolyase family protein [Vulcanococcus sp.]